MEKLCWLNPVTLRLYVPSALVVADEVPIVTVAPTTLAPVTMFVTLPANVAVDVVEEGLGAAGEATPPPPPHATVNTKQGIKPTTFVRTLKSFFTTHCPNV